MRQISLLFLLLLVITGCGVSKSTTSMPTERPEDFNFAVQFGYAVNNEINTFEGTVTKDLIEDGTATINISFSEEELDDIYQKMIDISITEKKNFVPKSNCSFDPHEKDEWKIVIDGETITHSISGEYCDPTEDAQDLIKLRNDILQMVETKDGYKELPEPSGGYD